MDQKEKNIFTDVQYQSHVGYRREAFVDKQIVITWCDVSWVWFFVLCVVVVRVLCCALVACWCGFAVFAVDCVQGVCVCVLLGVCVVMCSVRKKRNLIWTKTVKARMILSFTFPDVFHHLRHAMLIFQRCSPLFSRHACFARF